MIIEPIDKNTIHNQDEDGSHFTSNLHGALLGKQVIHKSFGEGTIVQSDDHRVEIKFNKFSEIKKFNYPDSFVSFISMVDPELHIKIIEEKRMYDQINKDRMDKAAQAARDIEILKIMEQDSPSPKKRVRSPKKDATSKNQGTGTTTVRKKTLKQAEKPAPKNNITFNCNFEENSMIEKITLSGDSMKITGVDVGSLAILSAKQPHEEDLERFIFGAFIIGTFVNSGQELDGYLEASKKYNITLTLSEAKQVRFWDYFYNASSPKKTVFGSEPYRIINDYQAAQVLQRICEIKKGTEEEAFMIEFFQFFCTLKKIISTNIPEPNGAFKRL